MIRSSSFRKISGLLVSLSLASCGGENSGKPENFDGDKAMRYAEAQLSFGPRIPGTSGATKAGDWIVAQMRLRADTVLTQTWTHTTVDGKRLPMRNILARFNPGSKERILYVTHWDTRPVSDLAENASERQIPVPGANDGASGVALFVALGDALKGTPPAVGVDLLFVDGEDYGQFDAEGADVLIGSRYFAEHLPDPSYRPIFGVLWDMVGDKDLRFKKEDFSIQQAPEVVDRVWAKAVELGYGKIFVNESQGMITDDHVPLLRAGLRVIEVLDLDYPYHHRPTDTLDKISARSLSIVGETAEALLR